VLYCCTFSILMHVICVTCTAGRVSSADGMDENGNPVEKTVDMTADVKPPSAAPGLLRLHSYVFMYLQ